MKRAPERKLVPDDPPDPIEECWYCNEDIYLDEDNNFPAIEAQGKIFPTCERDECLEAIGIELGWDKDFEELDDDYTFAEYVRDEGIAYKHILTEREEKELRAEQKFKERRDKDE